MEEIKCCGLCSYHRYMAMDEFMCENDQREAYGLSTIYDDVCEEFKEREENKMIDIRGLNKAAVLAELYNNSKPLGLGFLRFDPAKMTDEEAAKLLEQTTYFDYLKGRVMKIDLSSDEGFEEWLYDGDNGNGAAQRVIDKLRRDTADASIN